MRHKGSLPHSQQPASCHPLWDKTTPRPHTPILQHMFHINNPSMLRSSEWSPSSRFTQQNLRPFCSHPIRATWLAHQILLYVTSRIIFGENYRSWNSSLRGFFLRSPAPSTHLDPNIHVSICSSLNVTHQVSNPYKITRNLIATVRDFRLPPRCKWE